MFNSNSVSNKIKEIKYANIAKELGDGELGDLYRINNPVWKDGHGKRNNVWSHLAVIDNKASPLFSSLPFLNIIHLEINYGSVQLSVQQ